MRQMVYAYALLAFSSVAMATERPAPPILDEIEFQLTATQWVNTQTALLTVNLNATLTNADLVKARADILDKLAKISVGDWHLTQFERSQDGSGLEKLAVLAQARVAQNNLTHVYDNAKAVSKPGASYSVASIEFKPSLDELQHARAKLRENLYQQANDELSRINKTYENQHYSINRLVFVDNDKPIEASARGMMMAASAPTPLLNVSNELLMTALVQAASNRQ